MVTTDFKAWISWLSSRFPANRRRRNTTVIFEERRKGPRFACQLEAACLGIDDFSSEPWRGICREISCSGMSVHLDNPCEPGKLLEVSLKDVGRPHVSTRLLLILHSRQEAPDSWHLGGCFYTEIDYEELRILAG
jgi:hypothetical protein